MKTRNNSGFTLIELMIVVAIIAIIASIAIPKLLSARISANENAAVATLRSIASAQAQLQSACAIDTDADGGGEYGYFGEMAGTAPLRVFDPVAGAPALDAAGMVLTPSILPTAFGDTQLDANNEAVVERAGYIYKIFLPGPVNGGAIAGLAETGPAGVGGSAGAPFPDSDNCEILWSCYAWPSQARSTGNRAFFINQEGDLLQTANIENATNTAVFYDGFAAAAAIPVDIAAYSDGVGNPNVNAVGGMAEDLGITAQGLTANDGNVWTVVGN